MEINERTGEVVINQKKYHLTKYEVLALKELAKPGIRTYSDMYYAIYNTRVNNVELADRNCIKNIVSRLKAKTGIIVKTWFSYGYELGGTDE
jgi:ethanolamine ammonia-lyase small subunit